MSYLILIIYIYTGYIMNAVSPRIIWQEEGETFWQQLTFPEEDRQRRPLLGTAAIDGSDRPMSSAWRNIGNATRGGSRVVQSLPTPQHLLVLVFRLMVLVLAF
jgi:hypothetical protein